MSNGTQMEDLIRGLSRKWLINFPIERGSTRRGAFTFSGFVCNTLRRFGTCKDCWFKRLLSLVRPGTERVSGGETQTLSLRLQDGLASFVPRREA